MCLVEALLDVFHATDLPGRLGMIINLVCAFFFSIVENYDASIRLQQVPIGRGLMILPNWLLQPCGDLYFISWSVRPSEEILAK